MTIAIVNACDGPESGTVSRNLAVLRARSGRNTCIVDAGAGHRARGWCAARAALGAQPSVAGFTASRRGLLHDLAAWSRRFDDILLDVGLASTDVCWDALGAASLVLFLLPPAGLPEAREQALRARVQAVRLFNPQLRVLLAQSGAAGAIALDTWAAACTFALRLRLAWVSPAALPWAVGASASGCCACDDARGDAGLAGEMRVLYDSVFGPAAVAVAACAA